MIRISMPLHGPASYFARQVHLCRTGLFPTSAWRGPLTCRWSSSYMSVADLLLFIVSFQRFHRPLRRCVLRADPKSKNPRDVPGGWSPRTGAQGRVLHQKQVGERRPKVCAVQILFPIVLLFLRGIKNTIAASTIDHHFVVPKLVP